MSELFDDYTYKDVDNLLERLSFNNDGTIDIRGGGALSLMDITDLKDMGYLQVKLRPYRFELTEKGKFALAFSAELEDQREK